ncbi:MAG: beta-ketoacyl synthase N-terminal-like domain-containing protein, partial [Candidatus Promineifilaceae bacterium]|nr:beta-ketoacyl synthase N-terminal-like domain-containing protein [Candidatus Promineifilaceae bacterium]
LVRYITQGMQDVYRRNKRKPEPMAMLAITAAARDALKEFWESDSSSIYLALDNCPQQAILCGPLEEIVKVETRIKEKGLMSFRIPVLDQPIHTPLFPITQSELQHMYAAIAIKPPAVTVYSCASMAPFPQEQAQIRDLLAAQWSVPVRFRKTIERLYTDGIRTFVEVGPGGRLTGFVRDTLRGTDAVAIPTNLEKRDTILQLQICIAQLFTRGHDLNLSRLLDERLPLDDSTGRHAQDLLEHRHQETAPVLQSLPSSAEPSQPSTSAQQMPSAEVLQSAPSELVKTVMATDGRQRLRHLETHVLGQLAEIMELTGTDLIDPQQGFFDLGLNSLGAVELAVRLGSTLSLPLPETIAFDFPTTSRLAEFLYESLEHEYGASIDKSSSIAAANATPRTTHTAPADIAIIGMGCRFPGNASTPEAFWDLLINGRNAVTEVPEGRWPEDLNGEVQKEKHVRYGGFLGAITGFDNAFFGISPREAQSLDPQQRLLLEVTWEAIEHAALNQRNLTDVSTGVFIGISHTDYAQRLSAQERLAIKGYMGTGNAHSTAAGRLSFALGLSGPCLALDTACSSSLVTVHLACQSLHSGESEVAIAGGVNLLLSPETSIYLSQAHALSADGRCRTFDAEANGYVRAEGCGIILLKRLPDALAAGDNVLAVIRGSAINHDGRTSGLTVPNGPAQQAVIRRALASAGVTPDQVDMVESHGTGTSLGDPIEVQALGQVFSEGQEREEPLLLGAVKSNIGHLEAAAGIAGLIKIVLQLQHQQIVPNLHFRTPNPKISWDVLPLRVCTQPTPWLPGDRPRIAGISSFGMSGTNAHIIMQESPQIAAGAVTSTHIAHHLLTLSAKSEPALRSLAASFAAYLSSHEDFNVGDLCYTSNISRADFRHRLALVAGSREELLQGLKEVNDDHISPGGNGRYRVNYQRPRVAFLFSGQGAQYRDMGCQLFETEPIFRKALVTCDDLLQPYLGRSLLPLMFDIQTAGEPAVTTNQIRHNEKTLLDQTTYTQPALFALEYALVALWCSWGIEPDVVMGHSIGEYTAAHVAGVFSLEDAVQLVAARGKLMGSLPAGGAMLAVRGTESQIAAILDAAQIELAVAAVNGPQNVVLSGTETAVDQASEVLTAHDMSHTRLTVSHAFHSSLMDPILDEFRAVAANVTYNEPHLPLISNLTGRRAGSEILSPDYWTRQLRQPVRFAAGMATLHEEKCSVFLEIGPKPVSVALGQACIPANEQLWLPSLQPSQVDRRRMLASLADLYAYGVDVNWSGLHNGRSYRKLPLPTYPFQRERHWITPNASLEGEHLPTRNQQSLLGDSLMLPESAGQLRFEARVPATVTQLLSDYQVLGQHVLPLAVYLAIARCAAQELFAANNLQISEFNVPQALTLADEASLVLHTVLNSIQDGQYRCQIFSRQPADNEAAWTLHAAMVLRETTPIISEGDDTQLSESTHLAGNDFYITSTQMGFAYGEPFQVLRSLRLGAGSAAALIVLPDSLKDPANQALQQPALLDGAFQTLGAILFQQPERGIYFVRDIEQVNFYGDLPETLEVRAVCTWPADVAENPQVTVTLWAPDSKTLVAKITGISFSRVEFAAAAPDKKRRSATLEKVLNAPPEEKESILARRLQKLMARLLGLPRQEALDIAQPFTQLGLDSLMAMQMRNRVQADLGVDVPVARIIEGLSVATMTPLVLAGINSVSDATADGGQVNPLDEGIEWVEGEL